MKTNIITKWAALLLTFSGMAALPLNSFAESKTYASQNIVESGSSYEAGAATGEHALYLLTSTYSGTNITLTSAIQGNSALQSVASMATLTDSTIQASGTFAKGVFAIGGTLWLNNTNITATGDISRAVLSNGDNTTVYITGGTITSSGHRGRALGASTGVGQAFLYASNVTIIATGSSAAIMLENSGMQELNNCVIKASDGATVIEGGNDYYNPTGDTASLTVRGGSIKAEGNFFNLQEDVDGYDPSTPGNRIRINVTMEDVNAEIGGDLLKLNDYNATHNVYVPAEINMNLKSSSINGNVEVGGTASLTINLDDSTLTSNISGSNNTNVFISSSNGSVITGTIIGSGSSYTEVNLDNSQLNGGSNAGDDSTIIISGTNSQITGNLTGTGSSNTTVTITGPEGSFVGDVDQRDDSTITVNISGGASGKGGFIDGGNLNVIGGDSSFTFDKDSHGNNGFNDGTWNIGNKDVTFDNMDNNGKIVIDINSDDQSHGSFDVTGTASGTGKIQPNVTGTTAASQDDQDRIINELVKGNGKDVWDIGDFDWGLKEETVVTGSDGKLYVKDNGKLSTAGNIAVGLIAAQKGSWFAQQNSLLKRMGELRLQNSVESVTISGKEDKEVAAPMLSADKLIENVWIRAYGQQLNYGSSVTGQAFRQYVYGTDIGTDHKWTLDRNNALFTGIFAGYGAADTDHRHYGSKSEISNYYAGLYASWLNVDGWYLDATLKAQYTDNELNGYANGVDYFNGNYNNWSVGGSVEFGKQIKFKDDWFVEPQLQANYLHILAEDYTMSQGLNVNVSDLDAFQLRFGIVAGKTLKLKNGGALQPYFKISGVEMVSTGGKLSAMGNTVRPNLDGARAELGAGIIWQLDAHNQLHLDYEASFGDKYDKPWGLTAGYRYQF